ncbi:MAG: hypothetical protein AAF982_09805 [Pseudomonadota bacterium]
MIRQSRDLGYVAARWWVAAFAASSDPSMAMTCIRIVPDIV